MLTLAVYRCKKHNTWMISLNHGSIGQRLTRSKCCGKWDPVKEWTLSVSEARDLASEINTFVDGLVGEE
jgi:hypothetical protein